MKHVLLILGIALVFAGAFSIYSGYGIIEVERGWASVIAGATALTGGVITIALAWILGSLDRLRAAVETREVHLAQRALPAHEPAEPSDVPVAPATSSIRENALRQYREEPVFGPDIVEIAEWNSEPPAAPAPPLASPAPSRAPEPAAKIPPLPRASSAFVSAAAKARIEPLGEPSINDLWRRVGVNLDAAKFDKPADEPEPTNRQAQEAGPETKGADWLDQALARFDAAIAPESAETEEAPPLAPRSSPEQPAGPQPEVIGRYEAEGTAYVMYSDGSIDAQSDEGILRFKSMAELKAFFQS
jgi:hypothetical protein